MPAAAQLKTVRDSKPAKAAKASLASIDARPDIDVWVELVDDEEPSIGPDGKPIRSSSQVRRSRTRRRILKAGREIFATRGFGSPRVDDIANAADISRAAFYLHFKSLHELVLAVFRREVRWQLRRYYSLTSEIVTSEANLRQWIGKFLKSYSSERDYVLIMYHALTLDTGYLNVRYDTNQEIIEDMGRRIPELRVFDASGARDEKRILTLYQLMRSLSDISLHSAFDAWGGDLDFAIERTAANWAAFAAPTAAKRD